MFSEQVIVFAVLLLAFIVLLIFIRYWAFKIVRQNTSVLKYQRLDLLKGDIKVFGSKEFEHKVAELGKKGL